ncbi:MAG: peptide-methionine (S)-S-oxide reductase MsrA [Planctomycetota bacterium]
MTTTRRLTAGALLMLLTLAGFACNRYDQDPSAVSDPKVDEQLTTSSPDVAQGEDDVVLQTPTDPDVASTYKTVVLGGGCFWCVEAVYERIDGVIDVESGYAGGEPETANYRAVSSGRTRHAEVVRITYNPSQLTLGQILKVFFSVAHDPTTLNRQGNDEGPQYRSAIFYATDEQKQIAEAYIKQLTDEGVFSNPIVTTLESLEVFYIAEAYHQDYAENNPNQSYIRGVSTPKVRKLEAYFRDMLRENEPAE